MYLRTSLSPNTVFLLICNILFLKSFIGSSSIIFPTNCLFLYKYFHIIKLSSFVIIFPLDSTAKMLELAQELNADMVYGCFTKTGKEPYELENEYVGEFDYEYNPNALQAVLTGRYTRMGQLIRTEVLKKAHGADERVFIQDESIPLRAAIHAKGIIKMTANVVLVPKEIGNFSGNKVQLDNDRFMAYCYTILDNQGISEESLKLMYKRAVSAYWKYVKKTASFPYATKAFWVYLTNNLFPRKPNIAYLNQMKEEFLSLPNIRRIRK